MMINYIMIHGGNKETVGMCARGRWYYGYQYGSTCYGLPYMIDYVGDGSDFDSYVATMTHERPVQALVADFRNLDELDMVVSRMIKVAEMGIRPVVVAKFPGSLRLIPESVSGIKTIVGVSVPTRRGYMNDGTLPTSQEFKKYSYERRDIHLLGGHPDTWLFFNKYYSPVANIHSVDGNVLYEQAREYGKLWSRYGGYRELRGKGYSTNAITSAGMKNVVRYIETGYYYQSARIQLCKQKLGLIPSQNELFNLSELVA